MIKLYLYARRYLSVLLVCCSMGAFAQQTVTGKVTSSDDGSPIPGVNILEKGTTNGTVTDADGKYSISVGSNATLVFSFVGYISQEASVSGKTIADVSLVSDVTSLSEVVVVGYGSQDKKEITGAAVTVKSESFNRGNVNDPTQLLQGKVAGVSISKPGSDPNEGFAMRIRGVTSANATSPLVVIDGVIGASLSNVDPNDIASMDVLKDGSAAAIYGSRGSAGVILITTKKGKSGKAQIDVNSYLAIEEIAKAVPVMSAAEYVGIGGQDKGSSTDWLGQVTQTGQSKVTNIGLSGGAGNLTYRASFNYRSIQGILKGSGYDQINGRFNLQQNVLNNKIRVSMDMAITSRASNYSFQEALRYAAIYNPTAPIFEPDPVGAPNPYGSPFYERTLFDNFNPVGIISQNLNDGKKNTLNLSGKIEVDLLPGLTGVVSAAMQKDNSTTGQYYAIHANFRGYNRHGLASRNSDNSDFQLFEGYLNYTKQINDLHLSAIGGYSYQQQTFQGFGLTAGNFLSDALSYNQLPFSQDLATKGLISLSSYYSPDAKIVAFFGRLNLNYKETYLLSASLRHEGSTKFGVNNRYGDFPAVSGAVILSNLFSIPSVNSLKLRVGYGMTGALPIGNGISQFQLFQSTGSYYYNGGVQTPIVSSNLTPNPDLKWESKSEINAGVDFALLNNRLTGSIDWYQRTANDFIINRPVDPSTHVAGTQFQNVGEIQTSGIELALTYGVIQTADFKWSTTLVGTHYKSVLNTYPGTEGKTNGFADTNAGMGAPGQNNTYPVSVIAGEQVGVIYGPRFSGTVDSNGSPLMIAADGSLKLATDVAISNRSSSVVLGYGLPTFELGWTNSFTYKNFDLNFFLRGSFGHSLVNSWRAFYEPIVPGQINSYNRVTTKYSRSDIKDAQFSSYYVETADFIKLDNATIGYNIPMGAKSPISKLRVWVGGNNLFVITSYTGVDPEVRLQDINSADNGGFTSTTPDPFAPGIERRSTYFRSRTYTFGVNFTF